MPLPKNAALPQLRRLEQHDWAIWKNFRIAALTHNTESFPSSLEEELQAKDEQYQQMLQRNTIYGAFIADKLIGTAAFTPYNAQRERHRGFFFGMYVHHEYRGIGVASLLIEKVIALARSKVLQLHLRVISTNQGAIGLYRKYGFQHYGVEPRAIKIGETFYDEAIMVLFFPPPSKEDDSQPAG